MNGLFPIKKGTQDVLQKRQEHVDMLLDNCDGMTSVEDILEKLSEGDPEKREYFGEMISELHRQGYIVDSREQLMEMHHLSDNPSRFFRRASEEEFTDLSEKKPDYIIDYVSAYSDESESEDDYFLELLKKRISCRDFNNESPDLEEVLYIARCGYSMNIKPVASAGGLYPIVIYVLVRNASGDFALYAFDCEKDRLLLIEERADARLMEYALNDDEHVYNAPCIFFVMADLKRYSMKYANRGYRFALLEAGHVVQNMTLAAANRNMQSIEYGGFRDEAVRKLLEVDREWLVPLACLAAGQGDNSTEYAVPYHVAVLSELKEKGLIKSTREIHKGELAERGLMAVEVCFNHEDLNARGIAPCTKQAYLKAIFKGLADICRENKEDGYGAGQTEDDAKANAILDFQCSSTEQQDSSITERIVRNAFIGLFIDCDSRADISEDNFDFAQIKSPVSNVIIMKATRKI